MASALQHARSALEAETAARLSAQGSLRHADRLTTVGKLASGIAHELGTPLNVVDARARMIASRDVEGDEALQSAKIISSQVAQMTRIIRQLLDFARRGPPKRQTEPLRPLVRRTFELLGPLAHKRGVKLEERLEEAQLACVDPGGFAQVLTNLVMNAVQAMQTAGSVEVTATSERRTPPPELGGEPRDFVRVDVTDNGPGIAPEAVDRIFEPFFTTKDVGEGTGLGLSVSYGIVRDHGGWIGVESQPGRGARFSVYLPVEE
jgi:signal transduction histidine kinase